MFKKYLYDVFLYRYCTSSITQNYGHVSCFQIFHSSITVPWKSSYLYILQFVLWDKCLEMEFPWKNNFDTYCQTVPSFLWLTLWLQVCENADFPIPSPINTLLLLSFSANWHTKQTITLNFHLDVHTFAILGKFKRK